MTSICMQEGARESVCLCVCLCVCVRPLLKGTAMVCPRSSAATDWAPVTDHSEHGSAFCPQILVTPQCGTKSCWTTFRGLLSSWTAGNSLCHIYDTCRNNITCFIGNSNISLCYLSKKTTNYKKCAKISPIQASQISLSFFFFLFQIILHIISVIWFIFTALIPGVPACDCYAAPHLQGLSDSSITSLTVLSRL